MDADSSFAVKVADLRSALESKALDELESLWIEVAEEPDLPGSKLDALVDIARALTEQGEGERAAALLELLGPAFAEAEPGTHPSLVRYFDLLARLLPTDADVRRSLIEHFEAHHGPTTAERAFFECCGIRESGHSGKALERLDRLMKFREKACVYHEAGWGMGEVLAVDPFLKQVKVDLEHKKDHRIAIDAVDSILIALPEDSFRALRFRGRTEELARMASEESTGLVEKILECFGNPLPLKEIKGSLVPDVIAAGSWTKWWNVTKARLRETGFFRIGDRAPYAVERLESALSYEDDLLDRFAGATWAEVRKIGRTVLRGGEKEFPRAAPIVRRHLVDLAVTSDSAEQAIGAGILVARGDPSGEGGQSLEQAISHFAAEQIASALATAQRDDGMRMTLTRLWEQRPDDALEATRLALFGPLDTLRAVAVATLEERAPEELDRLIADLIRSPRRSPEAFLWLIGKRVSGARGRPFEPLEGRPAREILVLLLDLLEHLVDRMARDTRIAEIREALKRFEALCWQREAAFFREAVEDAPPELRRAAYEQLVRSARHLPRVGTRLLEVIATVDPQAARSDREDDAWWSGDTIWVTEEGLARHNEEFRVLTEEKIPANFEAVGKAADFGDLSENAEFTSALEEQKQLTERAERMRGELDRARVIDTERGRGESIEPGHRIRILDLDTDQELTYSILGPWDGLPEEGVLSYSSPLGAAFLGKAAEEEVDVELPGGTRRFRILELTSHFE